MEQVGKRSGRVSYGLHSIGQRLEILGGRMSIDSQAGQGTIVTLSIPLAAKQGADLAMMREGANN